MKSLIKLKRKSFENKLISKDFVSELLHKLNNSEQILTSYDYTANDMERFYGMDIERNTDLMTPITYVMFLEECVRNEEFYDLPKEMIKDLLYAKKMNITNFYLTVVLNMLLRDVHELGNVKMVQGMYKYSSDFFGFSESVEQQGVHAFSLVGDSVVDVCFYPQNIAFKTDESFIVGTVPEGVEFFGWQENISTEEGYKTMFARKNHRGSVAHFKYCHIVAYNELLLTLSTKK